MKHTVVHHHIDTRMDLFCGMFHVVVDVWFESSDVEVDSLTREPLHEIELARGGFVFLVATNDRDALSTRKGVEETFGVDTKEAPIVGVDIKRHVVVHDTDTVSF